MAGYSDDTGGYGRFSAVPYPQPHQAAGRVVIVEDEPLTRSLLAAVLQGAGFEVATADDARSGLAAIRETQPDVMVIDLGLGAGPGGVEILMWADRAAPNIAQIVLTNYPNGEIAGIPEGSIPERASFLNKRAMVDSQALVEAVRWAMAGMPPIRHDQDSDHNPAQVLAKLSRDQVEVLRLVAQGLSNAEIAARRGTTPHAVETLFHRTLQTLGVPRDKANNARVLAARLFYELGGFPS